MKLETAKRKFQLAFHELIEAAKKLTKAEKEYHICYQTSKKLEKHVKSLQMSKKQQKKP